MTIGRKIKEFRLAKEWTLADLTKHSGVVLSTLSRIESGKMTGTVESHLQIARALGIRLPELYAEIDPLSSKLEVRGASDAQKRFVTEKGESLNILTGGSLQKKLLPVLLSLKPGRSAKYEAGPPGAEKFLYLLKGKLEVTAGSQQALLGTGDSLHFEASRSHLLKNLGPTPATALSITSPPLL